MPNRRTSQLKIEDIVHCKCISLLNKTTSALLTQVQNYLKLRKNEMGIERVEIILPLTRSRMPNRRTSQLKIEDIELYK